MREKTQTHIRNQGAAIAEIRGALQAIAEESYCSKQYIQERVAIMEEKLATVQNNLSEIEFSEDLEWLEDKAGIEA